MKGLQKEWIDLKDEMGRESKDMAKVENDWKRLQETNMVRQPRNPLVTIMIVIVVLWLLSQIGSQQAT